MDLNKRASALGLYKYNCDKPESGLFARFYSAILGQLESSGVTPTYVAAEGSGYSGKLTKVAGRAHDKLVNSNFAGITVLSIVANPPGSDEPAYDEFASTSLSYVDANRELLACVVINELFMKLRSAEYDTLLRSLVELCRWDFGFGFSSCVEKQPEFHILGISNGKLSSDEYNSLCTWYETPGDVRTTLLRDIYAYNILNETQLDSQVSHGVTLRQFAQRQPGCSLTRLTDYGLYLWTVPDAEIAKLKKTLVGSRVLIS